MTISNTHQPPTAPVSRRSAEAQTAAPVSATTNAPLEPLAQRPWERKITPTITLIASEELGRNDEKRLMILRLINFRGQGQEYDRILGDGYPYILLGSTEGFLRGTTLSLLPLDLAAALSLSAACPHYSGKTRFDMLIGEQGDKQVLEVVSDTLAVLKHKTPSLFTVSFTTLTDQGAADANS